MSASGAVRSRRDRCGTRISIELGRLAVPALGGILEGLCQQVACHVAGPGRVGILVNQKARLDLRVGKRPSAASDLQIVQLRSAASALFGNRRFPSRASSSARAGSEAPRSRIADISALSVTAGAGAAAGGGCPAITGGGEGTGAGARTGTGIDAGDGSVARSAPSLGSSGTTASWWRCRPSATTTARHSAPSATMTSRGACASRSSSFQVRDFVARDGVRARSRRSGSR